MIVVFLGPPGSGKGTQAQLLAVRLNMVHLSTGDLLRAARAAGTPLGRQVAQYLDAGKLVPDEVVTGLVAERLVPHQDYLLDGFPRTVAQAQKLEELASGIGQEVSSVVLFVVPEEELVRRLMGRGRTDDTPETIRHRLKVYQEETAPLVGFYRQRGILCQVDGVGKVEDIHERLLSVLRIAPQG